MNAPAAPRPKNQNRGYLAPNKKGRDTHPDWRGRLTIEGKEYLLSGWFKDVTKDGQTVQIISFEATDPATLPPRPAYPAAAAPGTPAPSAPTPPPSSVAPSPTPASSTPEPGGGVFDDIFGPTQY
jgi:hypothetical protein